MEECIMEQQKNYFDLIIVGAGASGLMAAIQAHDELMKNGRNDIRILVVDKNDKAGKKLLATGNGRCNLTNRKQMTEYYMTTVQETDSVFIQSILEQFTYEDVVHFFEDNGMLTVDKGGYIYPRSMQAQTVVSQLVRMCEKRRIALQYQISVFQIKNKNNEYEIITENGKRLFTKALILAVGSQASVRGEYNGLQLAQSFGLKTEPQLPALCGLKADFSDVAFTKQGKSFFKEVAGVRSEVTCKVLVNKEVLSEESGELQLTDYGLSGIVIFCLSRYASRGLLQGKQVAICVDFVPDLKDSDLFAYIERTSDEDTTLLTALSGIMNQKLALGLIKILSGKYYNVQPDVKLAKLDSKVLQAFLKELKQFYVTIQDTNGFEKAQVCTGGVALSELTSELEVKSMKHLFLCGELLDVDGICGGYNLQWAWSSGTVAGIGAANTLL